MAEYKKQAEKIKTKLYRLHFLLTEPESDEIQKEGIEQFKICFKEVLGFLAEFLAEEFGLKAKTNMDILSASFEKKLFTESMTNSLKEMEHDFKNIRTTKSVDEIYKRIKGQHAHHLQVIYDMLTRMGDEIEDEEE